MEILETSIVKDISVLEMVGIGILMYVITLLALIVMSCESGEIILAFILALIPPAFFVTAMIVTGATEPKNQYRVLLTESSGYQELYEKYEIVEDYNPVFIVEDKDNR